jgi:hypothetical protein
MDLFRLGFDSINSFMEIVYRQLTIDDMDQYVDLHISCKEVMGIDTTTDDMDVFRDGMYKKLLDDRFLFYGAFDNSGLLITSGGGYFPKAFNTWYSGYHYSRVNDFTKFYDINLKIATPFIERAESMEYFSWYSRRSLKQQRAWFMINKMAQKNGIDTSPHNRYDHYIEKIYPANTVGTPYQNHQFWYQWRDSYPVDTIVVLHTLKPEYRLKLLKEKYETELNGYTDSIL